MVERSASPNLPGEDVLVGFVRRPHGVRGEVAVEPFSDQPGRFDRGAVLCCGGDVLTVEECRPHRDVLLMRFEGRTDRDAVTQLTGRQLTVPRSEVPPAPEGLVYTFELVGCRCIDRTRGEIGRVREVVADGGGYLLEVAGSSGEEVLVPFVHEFVEEIDTSAGKILLRLPEGLIEACGSE